MQPRTTLFQPFLFAGLLTLAAVPAAAGPAPKLDWANGDLLSQFQTVLKQSPPATLPDFSAAAAGPGPTKIVAAPKPLHCEPMVIQAFKDAWEKSSYGRRDYEAGFRIDLIEGKYRIVFAPMTYKRLTLTIPIIRGVTIAIAHTHPDSAESRPGPKDGDSPVPNYVISRRNLYLTDPATGGHSRVRRNWRAPCD